MSEIPARISVREVGPRDGLQNEDPVPTGAKVTLIEALSATGLGRIEAVSFVHPRAIPQMADADEVWKRARKAAGVRYSALVPNLRGAVRAIDAGFSELEAAAEGVTVHRRHGRLRQAKHGTKRFAEDGPLGEHLRIPHGVSLLEVRPHAERAVTGRGEHDDAGGAVGC